MVIWGGKLCSVLLSFALFHNGKLLFSSKILVSHPFILLYFLILKNIILTKTWFHCLFITMESSFHYNGGMQCKLTIKCDLICTSSQKWKHFYVIKITNLIPLSIDHNEAMFCYNREIQCKLTTKCDFIVYFDQQNLLPVVYWVCTS